MSSGELDLIRTIVPFDVSLEELEQRLEMQYVPAATEWCTGFACEGDCGEGQLCTTYCTCKGAYCECNEEHCPDLCTTDYSS